MRALAWVVILTLLPPTLLAGEQPISQKGGGKLRIAVMYFQDTTDWAWVRASWRSVVTAPYTSRALASMLSGDLAERPGVELVEREQVDALYLETALGQSGLVDDATAQNAGKTFAADVIVLGSIRRDKEYVRVIPYLYLAKDGTKERLRAIEGKTSDLLSIEAQVLDQLVTKLALKDPVSNAGKSPKPGDKTFSLAVLNLRDDSAAESEKSIGGALSDLLVNALASGAPRFKLVDRTQIQNVLTEKKLALAGMLSRSELASFTKIVGAELMLIGSFARGQDKLRIDLRLLHPESSTTFALLHETGAEKDALKIMSVLAERLAQLNIASLPAGTSKNIATPALSDKELEAQFAQSVRDYEAFLQVVYGNQPAKLEKLENLYTDFTPEQSAAGQDLVRQFKRYGYLRPKEGRYHAYLGMVLLDLGKFEEARAELDNAAKLGYQPHQCDFSVAYSWLREGKYAEACHAFEPLLNIKELQAQALYCLAEAWGAQGDPRKKGEFLAKVLAVAPDYAEDEFEAAEAALDKWSLAEQTVEEKRHVSGFRRALELQPDSLRNLFFLTEIWPREGNELDTMAEEKVMRGWLKQLSERTGNSYVRFAHERMKAERKNGKIVYQDVEKLPEQADAEYLGKYEPGPLPPKQNWENWMHWNRVITGQGYALYKLQFPNAQKIQANIVLPEQSDTVVKASPDGITWTEVQRRVAVQGVNFERVNFVRRDFHPIDLTKYSAANGTLYLRIEDATPEGGKCGGLRSITAIGIGRR